MNFLLNYLNLGINLIYYNYIYYIKNSLIIIKIIMKIFIMIKSIKKFRYLIKSF